MINYHEYMSLIRIAMSENKSLRKGQAYFNILYSLNKDLAMEINDTEFDPFYDDSRLGNFIAYLMPYFTWENI